MSWWDKYDIPVKMEVEFSRNDLNFLREAKQRGCAVVLSVSCRGDGKITLDKRLADEFVEAVLS